MLERLAFHETQNRGLGEIAVSVEVTEGKLGAKAGRERMFYRYGALRASLPLAVEVLRPQPRVSPEPSSVLPETQLTWKRTPTWFIHITV